MSIDFLDNKNQLRQLEERINDYSNMNIQDVTNGMHSEKSI